MSDGATTAPLGFKSLLEGPNPFADAALHESGHALTADVPTIGAELGRAVCDLVRAIRRDPNRRTRSLLVTGEPGSGKSHALRRASVTLAEESCVVAVDSYRAHRSLLPALVPKLLERLAGAGASHAESKLTRRLRRLCDRVGIPQDALMSTAPELTPRRIARRLARVVPEIERSLLTLLVHIVRSRAPFGPRRLACAIGSWLAGGAIDAAVRTTIGLRSSEPPLPPLEALRGIARLLRADTPILITIDALEGLVEDLDPSDARSAARGFVADLCRVYDTVPNCAVVVMCPTATWFTSFEPNLNHSERARVTGRRVELPALRALDAHEIVAARLQRHLGGRAVPYATFPFRAERLAKITPTTPRDLLALCAHETTRIRLRGQIDDRHAFGLDRVGNQGERRSQRTAELTQLFEDAIDRVPEAEALPRNEITWWLERGIRAIAGQRLLGRGGAAWRDGLHAYEQRLLDVQRDGIDRESGRALVALARLRAAASRGEVRVGQWVVKPAALLCDFAASGALERRIPIFSDLLAVLGAPAAAPPLQ